MKAAKRYVVRQLAPVTMRELEAGDRPRDHAGRELPFVPGDFFVEGPFQNWILASDLAETLYIEVED